MLGGFGESDIAYTYRQLSRALHPDKNPNVPEAQDAFKRLSEAADELRQGLNDARNALRLMLAAMGGTVTNEMLERPQEALMAEASRLLCAVLALAGEGEVSPTAASRAVAAFTQSSTFYNCQPQALLSQFFDMSALLDFYAGIPLRTAYDSSKKRFRAQFLCALNRVTMVEAKRQSDCIRGNWQEVLMQFPELSLWRELVEKLKVRVWTPDATEENEADREAQKRSKWDQGESAVPVKAASGWAKNWRRIIKSVLPRGIDTATKLTDPEVRKMTAALWRDVAEWASANGFERHIGLFSSDPVRSADGSFGPAPDQWCFIPQTDLLLIVGDGLAGVTAQGAFANSGPGHEPVTFQEAQQGKEKVKRQSRSKSNSKTREERKKDESERDKEKRTQQEGFGAFDWESEWRNRTKKRKPDGGRGGRSQDPPPRERERDRRRSRSRDRRRKDRSRSRDRRRSRSRRGRGGRD